MRGLREMIGMRDEKFFFCYNGREWRGSEGEGKNGRVVYIGTYLYIPKYHSRIFTILSRPSSSQT